MKIATKSLLMTVLLLCMPIALHAAVPVITTQPSQTTVDAGQAAVFSVAATGATSYQWRRNGTTINRATAATYTTPATASANNGDLYSVSVQNSSGTVTSASAALRVTGISLIAGQPGSGWGYADGAGTQARFWWPYGMTIDASDNLYVADWGVVRKITPAGVVSTLAGTLRTCGNSPGTGTAAIFCYPYSLTVSGAGNIILGDYGARVWSITPSGIATVLATGFTCTATVTATGSTLYVGDGCPGAVYKFSLGSAITQPYTPFSTLGGFPGQLALDGLGSSLQVANGTMVQTVPTAGTTGIASVLAGSLTPGSSEGVGPAASFGCATPAAGDEYLTPANGAFGITTDRTTGTSYVTDVCNNTIRAITKSGAVTTLAGSHGVIGAANGTGSSASFWHPYSIARDSKGNTYVGEAMNAVIRKITPKGKVSIFAGAPPLFGAADGTGASAQFRYPRAITRDSLGNFYITDTWNSTIRKIAAGGVVTTLAGSPLIFNAMNGQGSAARFDHPEGIVVDAAGAIYVADTGNHAIRKITAGGLVTTYAGTLKVAGYQDGPAASALLSAPSALTSDASSNLYFADANGIRKIASSGTVSTIIATSALPGGRITGLAVDSAGLLYFSALDRHAIYSVTQAGVLTYIAGSGASAYADGQGAAAAFGRAWNLAMGPDGNIYITDTYNGMIRKMTPGGLVTTVAGKLSTPVRAVLGGLSVGKIAGPTGIAFTSLPGKPISFAVLDNWESTVLQVDLP